MKPLQLPFDGTESQESDARKSEEQAKEDQRKSEGPLGEEISAALLASAAPATAASLASAALATTPEVSSLRNSKEDALISGTISVEGEPNLSIFFLLSCQSLSWSV